MGRYRNRCAASGFAGGLLSTLIFGYEHWFLGITIFPLLVGGANYYSLRDLSEKKRKEREEIEKSRTSKSYLVRH